MLNEIDTFFHVHSDTGKPNPKGEINVCMSFEEGKRMQQFGEKVHLPHMPNGKVVKKSEDGDFAHIDARHENVFKDINLPYEFTTKVCSYTTLADVNRHKFQN